MVLFVAINSPEAHDKADAGKSQQLMADGGQPAATDEYGADGIDEIAHGIDISGQIRPVGHGARGGEESTEEEHADHKEPHDEDGLLHGVGIV